MKHFWALPALLRPTLILAVQHAFSVHDDLLAFPQYEVKFSEDYIPDTQAQAHLHANEQPGVDGITNEVEHYPTHDGKEGGDGSGEEKEKLEYEMMVLDDQRYLCSIPQVEKVADQTDTGGNDTQARAEEAKELARANDRGWELLSGMQGNCVFFLSGWWSYRFCYGEGVRQFHQLPPARGMPVYPPVEDRGVDGYMLGVFDPKKVQQSKVGEDKGVEEAWEGEGALELSAGGKKKEGRLGELVTRGESRYLVQKMEGGTICDLTGRHRSIEVQFHCNPATGADRITLIKETSTCAYLMIVQTPRLCNDVAFLPPQKDAANAITCRPVLSPSEAETYQRDLQTHKNAAKEAEVWAADPDAAVAFGMEHVLSAAAASAQQIAGDIIVGARSILPAGVKLEKSAILGGGKETYIDTIANSEGRMLSKERIKELGLGDHKQVDKLKKEIAKMAGQEGWKLDVIDTPRGREYRGIIGDEEESEAKKKGTEGNAGEKAGKTKDEKAKDEKAHDEKAHDSAKGEETGSQEEYYKEEL